MSLGLPNSLPLSPGKILDYQNMDLYGNLLIDENIAASVICSSMTSVIFDVGDVSWEFGKQSSVLVNKSVSLIMLQLIDVLHCFADSILSI